MKDEIKIPRSLIASFLFDVSNCINKPFKDTKLDVSNALNKIEQIQRIIEEQDGNFEQKEIKNGKLKQLELL